ncbi:MurR/RpiR family transcriptional regulator [Caldilinea sp.]|jgi:DNA-binding MurR/RpiR family transcriptional regulator|uniref:MurR/RpiR family transcriptional regulator n=1 Tax=Caldilinea sp. TaxID=2293560 RepID=UPI0021DCB74C|nr:MurR/RpiR family transcriptional regulator [Caldilinea sp.]GIV70296.1 MAG: RpiR family transcriptional regulator [Caldilinea sp.]
MKNINNFERGALSVIADALPRLTGSAQKVAHFILNAPRETINLTITELAIKAGVSEASIVRFAQSLGYEGFHALKISLAEDIVSPMLLVHEDLGPNDSPGVAVQKVITAGMRSLEDTLHILDTFLLESVIQTLCNARQIELFASGNSIPLAMDLNFRLTKIGLRSRFSIDPTVQEMYASLVSAEDVAVGISHTGSSIDTVHALALAKERGACTIGITNHSNSPLTRHSDYCLLTSTRVTQFREEEMASNLAMLALTEAIYVGICVQRADASIQAASKTMQATRHRKY